MTLTPMTSTDASVQMADERTHLAVERSGMAAERTLMAWIRTALSMISFGFTIGKLGDVMRAAKVTLAFGREIDVLGVAYYLVILGTLTLILAAAQHRMSVAPLFRQGLTQRFSLAFFIALLLSVLGVLVFVDLVQQF
jgi:putative membrane protein